MPTGPGVGWYPAAFSAQGGSAAWIGLLYGVISGLLCLVVIGVFLLLVLAVWLIIRCAKRLMVIEKQQPVANVGTWLW